MTGQNNARQLVEQIKRQEWTPEVFEQTREMIRYGVRVFAILRQELSPEQYDKFDQEYCSHFRPQERQLTEWLRKERTGSRAGKETQRNDRKGQAGKGYRYQSNFGKLPENW